MALRDSFEEALSCVLGDALAFKLCRRTQRALKALTNQLREFMLFETQQFPTRQEVEKFYQEVEALRKRVDRLT